MLFGVSLDSGGMKILLWSVGSFRVLGEKFDFTCVLHVGVHDLRKPRCPDDFVFAQIRHERSREQSYNSVSSADSLAEDAK